MSNGSEVIGVRLLNGDWVIRKLLLTGLEKEVPNEVVVKGVKIKFLKVTRSNRRLYEEII